MKMLKYIPWIMVAISVFAALIDAVNAVLLFTRGQSFQHEGIAFLLRIGLATAIAALAWIAPILFRHNQTKKAYFQAAVWLALVIFATWVNMMCSKAYVSSTWGAPVPGVSGPANIRLFGISVYQTDDWFRDIIAFYPNVILFSMVAVSLEKEKLSPEEERQKLQEEIEFAKIAKQRREQLEPLKEENLEQATKGFMNKMRAAARGAGIEIPERQRKKALEEAVAASKGDVALEAIVSEGELVALTEKDLTPVQVGIILAPPGKKALGERTIRARCAQAPGTPGYIRAHKRTVKGHGVWIINADELAEDYKEEWSAYLKSKAKQTRAHSHRRDARRNEPIALRQ